MNYKEVYSQETVDKIEELLADSYALEDIVEFIDANSEADFRSYYQNYVEIGEEYSYEAVDAFIDQFGIHSLVGDNFQDAYRGQYDCKADYAEQYTSDVYSVEVPVLWKLIGKQHLITWMLFSPKLVMCSTLNSEL